MIPLVEPSAELAIVLRNYKRLTQQIMSELPVRWVEWRSGSTYNLFDEGLPKDAVVFVEAGSIEVMQEDKSLYYWDDGDLFFCTDYFREQDEENIGPKLVVGDSVSCKLTKLSLIQQAIAANDVYREIWENWLSIQRQLLHQLICRLVKPEQRPNPGFTRFNDGDVIIHEGDISDCVYTIMDGAADVFVNNVKVGEIEQDEIFGAIAVLTGQRRSATVKARGGCNVLMVPQTEFSSMLNTHPQLFMNLLKDMAKTITSLNERVVSLEGR